MLSTTIQLAVRGKPSAFDLNFDTDTCVVASPGCLTFFHLTGVGSPCHVIHYEQPQQIRQLRFQKFGLLAALRGGVISLWDPSKSLRPLIGFIRGSGWITDLSWHSTNHNMLATSSDSNGGVCFWDIRSPLYPTTHMFAGQVATSVDWCPSNANLLAACSDAQNVYIWDIRMIGSNATCAATIGSKNEAYATINSKSSVSSSSGILQCCWCGSMERNDAMPTVSSSSIPHSIIVGRSNGSVEWWDINMDSSTLMSSRAGISAASTSGLPVVSTEFAASQSPEFVNSSSIMLATPYGRGAIVCKPLDTATIQRAEYNNLTNKDKKNSNLRKSLQTEAKPNYPNSSNTNYDQFAEDNTKIRMGISLFGYPREGLALEKVFTPLSPDISQRTILSKEGSSSLLATCCEPILALRWGTPGRLLPSMYGSLELLAVTESAALHVIRIPLGTSPQEFISPREKGENNLTISGINADSHKVEDEMGRPDGVLIGSIKPVYSLKRSHTAPNNNIELHGQSQSIQNLRSSLLNRSTHPIRSAIEGESLPSANITVNSTTGIGYETDPYKMEFYALLQREVLELEEELQKGILEGLSISRVDQYARQVTIQIQQVLSLILEPSLCISASLFL